MNSEDYSLQSSLEKGCQSLNESFTRCVQDLEDKVRSTPLAAVSFAVGIGYLLRFFPIALILGIIAKLFFFALKPLILIFGAVKLYEFIQKQSGEVRSSAETERDREPLLDSPSGPPGA